MDCCAPKKSSKASTPRNKSEEPFSSAMEPKCESIPASEVVRALSFTCIRGDLELQLCKQRFDAMQTKEFKSFVYTAVVQDHHGYM